MDCNALGNFICLVPSPNKANCPLDKAIELAYKQVKKNNCATLYLEELAREEH